MADRDQMPDEFQADEAVVDRLRAWYADRPPEGALDRALAHVEDRSKANNGLTISTRRDTRRFATRLAALAAAVASLAVGMKAINRSVPQAWQPSPTIGDAAADNRRLVRFAVMLPSEAPSEVRLLGDFNGWGPGGLMLRQNPTTGRWEGNVELSPGLHHYTFLVDGSRWVIDPGAPSSGDDLLGETNAIVVPEVR